MATILKEAFIHKILSKLTPEQLQTLSNYANGTNLPAKTSITLQQYQTNTISEANIGITHARMTLNAGQHLILDGFLCYVDNSNCGFFAYFGDTVENMNSIKIDPANLKYEFMDEGLDIEEFRRELNDLAGGSGGVTEEEVQNLIQADKDILSKIEVIEEGNYTAFIFPKGVLPIKFCHVGNDYIFMNYSSGIIVDGNGDESDAWAMSITADSRISLEYQSHGGTIDIIDELYFINFVGTIDISEAGNWYTILNATKMYAHKINFSSSDSIRFISPFSYQYDIENLMRTFINYGISMLISSADFGSGKILAMDRILDQQKLTVIYYDGSEAAITTVNIQYKENPQDWTDTVTPL